jgi:hypothetical protein
MRNRILVSAAVGTGTGAFCWLVLHHLHQHAADFGWALHLAEKLVARQNPYDTPFEQYPLTAGLLALPFLPFTSETAAALFYGISSALLSFGLSRHGYQRLLVFFAYPYWAGLLTVQWAPLIAAGAFFPLLLPVTLAKPQIGLPVFLTRASLRGVVATVVLFLFSIAVTPKWPLLWIAQTTYYQHFIPLFVVPGPLLLLALLRYRDRDAILLLLMACVPQRWFFDTFILWVIPRSRREIVWTAFWSWGAGLWRWYHVPHSFAQVGSWAVVFIYLPMLVVILLRSHASSGSLDDNALPR